MNIPKIQLTSAVIALIKLADQPDLLAKKERIMIDQFARNHKAMSRKEITDALWARFVAMHNERGRA